MSVFETISHLVTLALQVWILILVYRRRAVPAWVYDANGWGDVQNITRRGLDFDVRRVLVRADPDLIPRIEARLLQLLAKEGKSAEDYSRIDHLNRELQIVLAAAEPDEEAEEWP